jgi:hypothetical protein
LARCESIGVKVLFIEGKIWVVPTVNIVGSEIRHTGGTFSGSGTPQWEYGAEAARTTWRVAIDAALYPNEQSNAAGPYLNPLLTTLKDGYNPNLSFNEKYFAADTFTSCQLPGVSSGTITSFSGGWVWNAFIFAPTVSSLVVPIEGVSEVEQQEMIDKIGTVLASGIPQSYYHRCWTVLSILTLNGAMESAGKRLSSPTAPTSQPAPTSPPQPAPTQPPQPAPTSPPQQAPTQPPQQAPTQPPVVSEGCYSKNYKNCLPPGYTSETEDTCGQIWLPDGERSNCVALWGKCIGSSDCCGEAVCFGDNEPTACVPPSGDPDTVAPTPTPVECIICDDVESPWMIDNGKDCATETKLHKKCNKNNNWTKNNICQLSCYKAGHGYPGDICCNA